MDTLNFLKIQPLANWLDYFLDRQKFFDLIADAQNNESTIAQLLDQFVEQALNSSKELSQLERKQMDEDDVIYMRHKIDELWLCALCCLAAINWDLVLLMKSLNILKIQALWTKLLNWVSDQKIDDQTINVEVDNFCIPVFNFSDLSKLTPEKTFIISIYSQWVLLVDITARFPMPSAKPTVSNPFNQVDQNLLQAERIFSATIKVRANMPNAVKQLNYLLESLNDNSIGVLGPECFYVDYKSISSATFGALKIRPAPNFQKQCIIVDQLAFSTKIQFALMTAHFAAKHFISAQKLLLKINANFLQLKDVWLGMPTSVQKLLKINESELQAYNLALNSTNEPPRKMPFLIPSAKSPDKSHARILIHTALQRMNYTPIDVIEALMHGFCVSNKFLRLMNVENFRVEFLEEVTKQFWSSTPTGLADRNNKKQLHVFSALYFFCLVSPGFSEMLLAHPRLGSLSKWRKLTSSVETPVSEPPNDVEIQSLSASGPPLWNVLTSFDLEIIRAGLLALGNNFKLPYKHKVSEVIGETLLNRSGRIYNQIILYLWKLEQLVGLNNSTKWKKFINGFMNVIKDVLDEELQKLLAFDLIRAEIDIWNRQLCRVENLKDFMERTGEHLNVTLKSIYCANAETTAFIKFALPLSNFLLNNRNWMHIIVNMENKCFKSPFTDLARVLATYFTQIYECRDVEKAMLASDTFWKVMWPTFELTKDPITGVMRRQGPILLTKQQFLDFITNLKEPNVLEFLFSYLIFLLNSVLAFENAEKNTQQQAAAQQQPISPQITSLTAAILSEKWIFTPKDGIIWRKLHCDANALDVEYIKLVLEVLFKNAMLVNPVNINVLKICGDFYFVTEKFEIAIVYYLEVVIAAQRKFCGDSIDFDLDNVFARIVIGCAALQMPTLAAITGQLRSNPTPHYCHIDWILQSTPNTVGILVDAGPAYFPLIADITLLEYMAASYNKYGLTIYAQTLMKTMPTKAINVNNSPKVLQREIASRKKRFLDILFNHFFKRNV